MDTPVYLLNPKFVIIKSCCQTSAGLVYRYCTPTRFRVASSADAH